MRETHDIGYAVLYLATVGSYVVTMYIFPNASYLFSECDKFSCGRWSVAWGDGAIPEIWQGFVDDKQINEKENPKGKAIVTWLCEHGVDTCSNLNDFWNDTQMLSLFQICEWCGIESKSNK